MEQIGQKVSIDGKYTQLQAANYYTHTKKNHKTHFGTVMLVQMQLSPMLSDRNKTLKY